MKVCPGCGKKKDLKTGYSFNNATFDKRQRICKECDKKQSAIRYQNKIMDNRENRKLWQAKNRELHNKHCRDYQARRKAKLNK